MASTLVGKPDDRWLAFGMLYEEFGASFEMIAQAAGVTVPHVQRMARQRNWKSCASFAKLHMRLADAFELHLNMMSMSGFDEIAAEKRSRILSSTTKSLELLKSINGDPTALSDAKQDNQSPFADDEILDETARIEHLARQLEKIVGSNGQDGETKRSGSTA